MNIILEAECICITPVDNMNHLTLVNPTNSTSYVLGQLQAWKPIDMLNLVDTNAQGVRDRCELTDHWFIDYKKCDSTANVLMVRVLDRSLLGIRTLDEIEAEKQRLNKGVPL